MEPLNRDQLLNSLDQLGYQLARPAVQADPLRTLKEAITQNDHRILEGIPVVLAHVLTQQESELNLGELAELLPAPLRKRFQILAAVTFHFLFWVPESDKAKTKIGKFLTKNDPNVISTVKEKLQSGSSIALGSGISVDPKRLETTFKNYVIGTMQAQEARISDRLEQQRTSAFYDALNELFAAKQREILLKTLKHEPLTKTEREYYSRVIKRRLKALLNSDVQAMAMSLIGA